MLRSWTRRSAAIIAVLATLVLGGLTGDAAGASGTDVARNADDIGQQGLPTATDVGAAVTPGCTSQAPPPWWFDHYATFTGPQRCNYCYELARYMHDVQGLDVWCWEVSSERAELHVNT